MFLWYLAKMVVIVVLLLNDLISTNHLKGWEHSVQCTTTVPLLSCYIWMTSFLQGFHIWMSGRMGDTQCSNNHFQVLAPTLKVWVGAFAPLKVLGHACARSIVWIVDALAGSFCHVGSDVSHFSLLVCSSFCRTCLFATSYAWCIFCLFGTLAYVLQACKNSWNIQVGAPTELSWWSF